jgi:outer membrane protein assembly factor BamE
MTAQQVRYVLGSPAITDTLNPNRWDYIYNYIPGTNARRAHLKATSGQHLRVYFDDQGIVTKVEGQETIPNSQPGLPASQDPTLSAPPL